MAKNQNYRDIMIEEMDDNIKTILEIVVPMNERLVRVERIVEDIPEMKADIKTIKSALTQTNIQVKDHEKRITKLEAKPA